MHFYGVGMQQLLINLRMKTMGDKEKKKAKTIHCILSAHIFWIKCSASHHELLRSSFTKKA